MSQILGNGGVQSLTPLWVCQINFWPTWSHEHALMVAVSFAKRRQHRLARQILKASSCVNQTSIKENPTF